jgi:hypothetical protein
MLGSGTYFVGAPLPSVARCSYLRMVIFAASAILQRREEARQRVLELEHLTEALQRVEFAYLIGGAEGLILLKGLVSGADDAIVSDLHLARNHIFAKSLAGAVDF